MADPYSGGKANAIELKAKVAEDASGSDPDAEGAWIVLTDDEPEGGGLWILEWDGEGSGGVKIVVEWEGDEGGSMDGASHAVWLD